MSDHKPLIFNSELNGKQILKPFCLENSWLEHANLSPKSLKSRARTLLQVMLQKDGALK
jgi:hypothetical protein